MGNGNDIIFGGGTNTLTNTDNLGTIELNC